MLDEFGYELYSGPNGSCFFCGRSRTHTFRTPPLATSKSDVQSVIEHRAYNVCPKCLARCIRKGHNRSHEQLIEYVKFLENRGSVRGRVKMNDIEVKLSIPLSNVEEIQSALDSHFNFETHLGPLQIINIIIDDGKIKIILSQVGNV